MCSYSCPCLQSEKGTNWRDEKDLNSHGRTSKNENFKDPITGKYYLRMYFQDDDIKPKKSDIATNETEILLYYSKPYDCLKRIA